MRKLRQVYKFRCMWPWEQSLLPILNIAINHTGLGPEELGPISYRSSSSSLNSLEAQNPSSDSGFILNLMKVFTGYLSYLSIAVTNTMTKP